ncbi:helix-turn-helix transcriptional regulator [Seonamhaeicola sp.]|uniref:helix-turn-helix domain-containing protein n=1 Tax=Seonamhaeicola sp. TaxID=1912245 RepID=UPI002616529D|nr:helix-turn-helix transcriptional regulator [Seonamhaeicola sp.]
MDKIDNDEAKKKFGKHIVKLRERVRSADYPERGISQQELSDKSDCITKKTLGAIERGETNPKFETLIALANVLGVSLKELFDFEIEDM